MMGKLQAGMSEIVITPPVGVRLAGYSARVDPSIGVLDDLYAKALVLDNGQARIALVVCDLLELGREISSSIRSRAAELTGIDRSSIMVAATHTHCGPDLDRIEEATIDHLIRQISGAVRAAASGLREASLGFGAGRCRAGANRRYPRSPHGPYFLYADPEGTVDETVAAISIRDAEGGIMGALVNYACHPVALGPEELLVSKDYVHFTCRTLKSAWGQSAVPVFVQGCAGNINPNWIYDDATRASPPQRVFPASLHERLRETRRLGHMVGGAALTAVESITRYAGDVELGAATRTVELPVRDDLPPELRAIVDRVRGATGPARGKLRGLERALAEREPRIRTEVQALRMGDALLVGLPGEIFVEWQIEIRKQLGGRDVLVSELANDAISYVPTPEAFREGGYEPKVAFFAPGAGALLVESAVEAARELAGR